MVDEINLDNLVCDVPDPIFETMCEATQTDNPRVAMKKILWV